MREKERVEKTLLLARSGAEEEICIGTVEGDDEEDWKIVSLDGRSAALP